MLTDSVSSRGSTLRRPRVGFLLVPDRGSTPRGGRSSATFWQKMMGNDAFGQYSDIKTRKMTLMTSSMTSNFQILSKCVIFDHFWPKCRRGSSSSGGRTPVRDEQKADLGSPEGQTPTGYTVWQRRNGRSLTLGSHGSDAGATLNVGVVPDVKE